MGTATGSVVMIATKNIFEVLRRDIFLFGLFFSCLADFRTVSPYGKDVYDHRTGQKCTRCGGALHDSIVNFGENLPPRDLTLARDNAETADLCLVLGSSLTVTPANGIPEIVGQKNRAKLAICNLQATPIDELAEFRIFCEADVLMMKVMEKLATEVDSDGTPVTFLQSVRLEGSRRVAREEPFIIHVRELLQPGSQLNLELEFMGHYNEPNLVLAHNYNGEEEILYILSFNPQNGQWVIEIGESLT
ncbi:hypothetical protein N7474_007495 [Penicillium riverlandense]|uniref:uncharacterized protein n=1 Tax=Penicillium riverlandense TaxID=1903569 RepID=UPI0025467E03|nr:uncharacterized protein N7474_007495 [Penicillium riverlandense]KAJ5815718.1 hypothetical protein N7474_007495 [Penicillium riverlandense]